MLDKDNLIDILIDWVEESKKKDNNEINFTTIEDIKKVCGGHWMNFINGEAFIDNEKHGKNILNSNPDYYLKIKNDMIKNGWDKEQPAILNFIDTKEKKEDGWISDIVVSNGNHRIAMVDLHKIDTKIPIKFEFNEYSYLENRWGKKPLIKHDKNGNVYWPLRRMIKYEYD